MMYTDVMLDLETLGTAPGSVILSIGAVAFTEGQPEAEWSMFNSGPIRLSSSRAFGLQIDDKTLAWWLAQEQTAKGILWAALQDTAITPDLALTRWADGLPLTPKMWGNGADFDNALMKAAWELCLPVYALPWKFYDNRCFRTMKSVFTEVPAPPFAGVKHDALADALHQTRWLQAIWAHAKAAR